MSECPFDMDSAYDFLDYLGFNWEIVSIEVGESLEICESRYLIYINRENLVDVCKTV